MDLDQASDTAIVETHGYHLRTFIDDDDPTVAHVIVGTERSPREDSFAAAWDGETLAREYSFSRDICEDDDVYRALERALERLQRGHG